MPRSSHLSPASAAPWATARTLVNVVVTAGLAYALYRQFFVVNDLPSLYVGFRQNLPAGFVYYILAAIALMPLNLLLEAYKLRVTLPPNLRAPWLETLGQVCAGLTVGLWTPGRLGEFAGRMTRTRVAQRGPMVAATALGGMAQWAPLLIGGGAAVLFWRKLNSPTAGTAEGLATYLTSDALQWGGGISVVLGVASAVAVWYAPSVVKAVLKRSVPAVLRGLSGHLGLDALVRPDFLRAVERQRGGLLLASVGRYLVYLTQMSLAFVAFGLPTSVGAAIAGTAALLLLHGFLPVPPALQAVARIEFALLLFAYSDPNEVSIAAASLFVFVLNLGSPALAGWLFILRRNDLSLSP